MINYEEIPRDEVLIDMKEERELELWRHSVGDGGVNNLPLPEKVVTGVKSLKPRLIRIFIQEYFNVYPDHDTYNWTKLDKYMESLSKTGAKVVASINIKPKVLYPQIDQTIWEPNNIKEWQTLIANMVNRYSVEKEIVTHWEIGNEDDIGENGGCPYLIQDPNDYYDFYKMTIKPILEVFPESKVGGPANASVYSEPLPGFVKLCAEKGTQLDFISWHIYNSDPEQHIKGIKKANNLINELFEQKPETMVTEWNIGFPQVSVEEIAFLPRRAANVAVIILDMMEAGLDWSFYYHIWDQTLYREPFQKFYDKVDTLMGRHWNEIPHRFGLFGVNKEVRPQYFVYKILASLGSKRLAVKTDEKDIYALATQDEKGISILLVNFNSQLSQDRIIDLKFSNLKPGIKNIITYRIDSQQRWSEEKLELLPVENREVDVPENYFCQIYLPADSVMLFKLEDVHN